MEKGEQKNTEIITSKHQRKNHQKLNMKNNHSGTEMTSGQEK